MAKNKKMYIIRSVNKDYLYGAFPYTEEGEKQALKYQKKLKREKKINTYIIER